MNGVEETCPHCGANLRPYRVQITPMMVKALLKFRSAVYLKGKNEVHLLEDMVGDFELNRHEWNNFTRQRFLGLAVKVKDRAGYWLLTRRGSEFLNGQQAIPEYVSIFRNRIVARSEKLVFVSEVVGKVPYMEALSDIVYEEPMDLAMLTPPAAKPVIKEPVIVEPGGQSLLFSMKDEMYGN